MEEGDRGGHGPKNNQSVIKDKENLTEITLFVNIFEFRPFPPPLIKPLDPEDNLQTIQRLSPYFTTNSLRLMRKFEILIAVLLRFLVF